MLAIALLEGNGINLWEVVLHGGPVAKAVLLLLILFSVISWVVIIMKGLLISRSRRATESFRAAFRRTNDWRELKQQAEMEQNVERLYQIVAEKFLSK